MTMKHIAIIGAGAIGGVLGALLQRAGYEVTLIGRPAQVQAIRRNGLRVEGCLGTFTVHPAAAEALESRPELVFLTVKAQDVVAALQANAAFLTGVPLVTCQNGIRGDELAATLLPRDQLISAVVMTGANYLTPGTVTVASPGALVIGRSYGPLDDQVGDVAAVLHAVISTRTTANILGAHWLKLIVNLNNALPALTDTTLQRVFADPYLSRVSVRMMREGLHVNGRAGIRLEPIPGVPAVLIRLVANLPMRLATLILNTSARRLYTDVPVLGSTLQSVRRGRPTEIDYLNGEVVRTGRQLDVPVPLNTAVVELVHQTEQTGKFFTVDELRARLT